MCFVHCKPRACIPSINTAKMTTIELEPTLHRVPCQYDVRKHSPRPSDGTRPRFLNVKKTTDIMTYETDEKRALHCTVVHNREHDGDERLKYQVLQTEPSTLATMLAPCTKRPTENCEPGAVRPLRIKFIKI